MTNRCFVLTFAILVVLLAATTTLSQSHPSTPTPHEASERRPEETTTPFPPQNEGERLDEMEKRIAELEQQPYQPHKDFWDKVGAISGLLSGLLIAIVGGFATYVYQERQRSSQEAHNEQQRTILQVQTVQGFMPQLLSKDSKAVEAALLGISALGNSDLATNLADLFGTEGAIQALSALSESADSTTADTAQKILRNQFKSIAPTIVRVAESCVGFIVTAEGHILTLNKGLGQTTEAKNLVTVTFGDIDYEAEIISVDKNSPLALAKIAPEQAPFSFLPICKEPTSSLLGERVFVFARGLDTDNRTSTWRNEIKIVHGKVRTYMAYTWTYFEIQSDTHTETILPGSPVLNPRKQVVGIIHQARADATTNTTSTIAVEAEYMARYIRSHIPDF